MGKENILSPQKAPIKTICEFRVGPKIIRLKTVKGALPLFYEDDDGVLKTSAGIGPNQRTRFMLDIDARTPQPSISST
ncbi:hypothetical protein A2985_00565 [Candidatus Woesebacteria bacterium RIFCSPLOWO2_01_FULL_43_11]|uniref:Uncharacterized protein n=1 Tax=Candidatus Woesebacteria bacterium RBG_16_42_24 TaxID=1802485 RepID=A0A1F7XJU5_9BACT|nr:MAG: hypothetical protein A2V97_01445 [Candidatus Woesebacteria bacterium RBG_16_42_24]OGM67636.1 MAG: hypothetical protein A2985_00565 [Candidatus Woesebacteria bacterium RIFCSPLOWO2_01_FULL_43_11]